MKVMVSAVSFAFLSLFFSSSIALSQDTAEEIALSSSTQTTLRAELVKPVKLNELPDAPSFLEAPNAPSSTGRVSASPLSS